MTTARRIFYGFGNAGFQITERIVVAVAIYFYLPPPDRGLEPQVPAAVFLGVFTVYGLAMQFGRLVDSLADPLVGFASDRSRSRLGRRRSFMILGIGPMVVLPALLFWPPGAPGSPLNALWLGGLLAVYFVFYTIYVAPYLALIPEIAWSQNERVRLASILALAALPALVGFGFAWPLGMDLGRAAGLSAPAALRAVVVVFSLLAFLLCLAPILAVDERRFARSNPANLSLRRALATTLRNRAFCIYLAAQLLFVFGINIVQPLLPYMATVVLGRSEGFAALLGGSMLVGLALGFAVVPVLARRFGPKRVMMVCMLVFAGCMGSLGLLEADVPGGPHDRANLAIVILSLALTGFPVVCFLMLGHVLISQLIDEDEGRTGANRSAIFFGVQGLLTKWMYGASLWALSFLLSRFGNSPEQPLGVLLVGPVAAVACLFSLVFFALYPERDVLEATRRSPETPPA